jgi:hypothetical protein
MTVRLNQEGIAHARSLLRRGELTNDTRDDWSEHAPSVREDNAFIEKNGMAEWAKWHLAEDTEKTAGTRGRYLFPYGDFARLHRCAVIAGESRAGQYRYSAVENALRDLREGIDTKSST